MKTVFVSFSTHSHSTGGGDGGRLSTIPSVRTPHSPFMQTVIPATREESKKEGADDELEFPLEASVGGKAMALMFQAKDLQEQVYVNVCIMLRNFVKL